MTANAIAKINVVAEAEALTELKRGLRALNRALELPGVNLLKDAHATMDPAVLSACDFDPKQDTGATARVESEHCRPHCVRRTRDGSGVPPGYPGLANLATEDYTSGA